VSAALYPTAGRERASARREALIEFDLPSRLEAAGPPEERGLGRDDVRLLVARRAGQGIEHRRFIDLPLLLERGDVLVVNTSATLPASLEAQTLAGVPAELHLSTRDPDGATDGPDGRWVVELRHAPGGEMRPDRRPASTPWLDAAAGTVVRLADGGAVRLLAPAASPALPGMATRLWTAELSLPCPLSHYLARHGRPIRYGYIDRDWPIAAYQTIFAETPGSAEMASAARPFSPELVTRLVARGIVFAPVTLHAGVASPEAQEPPSAEWYDVPTETAELVNLARRLGHRAIAVGTTAVRALETAAGTAGTIHPGTGWTTLVIDRGRRVQSVDGLITGWHEPHASHLAILEAVAGRTLLEASYREAIASGYLWHEFGDSHLILP
jgi:S-adenosylmethionine:tRNA ribosyltransferase-isomerase